MAVAQRDKASGDEALTIRTCHVPGCEGAVMYRGYCEAHYRRLRLYGDPLGGGGFRASRRQMLSALDSAVAYVGDECFIWPHARNSAGYGHMVIDGSHKLVHRIVCEAHNGPPPQDMPMAAHSCGNGHMGCCNPRHLSWKSARGNSADTIKHGRSCRGTRHYLSVLTEGDIPTIRKMGETKPIGDIARQFMTSYGVIYAVVRRRSWAWVPEDAA